MTANDAARFGSSYESSLLAILDNDFQNLGEGPADTTSFKAQETTPPIDPVTTYRGRFMAGKELEYKATEEAYQILYGSPSNHHLMGIRECRRYAKFSREKTTGDVRIMTDSCRDRWCPMCAEQKAKYAKDSAEIYIKSMKVPRFLTLTLRNNDNGLAEQIDFLQGSFRRIRQRAYWKKNVTGGIWFLQVKRGHNSGCWHPHLHILLDGNYMEQGKLSDLWELVTFGSPVIDIRKIHDPESAASYVSRYTARPAALADMSVEDRLVVIKALFGKRLSGTFGTGKTVTLTPPKIDDGTEWQDIGNYNDIVRDAERDPHARAIIDAWSENYPLTEDQFEKYAGHPVRYEVPDYVNKKPVQYLLDFYNT